MAKNIVLYITDAHGETEVYEEFFKLGAGKNVKAVIIGGDVNPFIMGAGEDNIEVQREFLKRYLIPRIREFRKLWKKPVFIMFGNDDFKVNYDLLIKAKKERVLKLLHQNVHKLKGYFICGYSIVNPTPFILKDWEKSEKEIEKDLKKMEGRCRGKCITVFHAPPFNTNLDLLYTGEHVGSKSIREFIERAQPELSLHGHIHESPEISGCVTDKIGNTLCINPGSGKIVLIDLDNINNIILA